MLQTKAAKEAARKKHRQKHRHRGKKGKKSKKVAAATEPTTKTLTKRASHAESYIDSLGSVDLEDSTSSFATGQVHSESTLDLFLYASTTCSEEHTSESLDLDALFDGDDLNTFDVRLFHYTS